MTNKDSGHDSKGLIYAYELDGKGSGNILDWLKIDSPSPAHGTRWIHLDYTKREACQWLRSNSGLDVVIADALLDDDSRPRVVEYDNGLLLILRGVNMNPGADPEDMVSIRLCVESNRIISTRRRQLLPVQAIKDDIANGNGPRTSGDFLMALVSKLDDRISPVIDKLDQEIEQAELQFADEMATTYRGDFASLRRQAVRIRRFLAPQREGIERLAKEQIGLLTNEQKFALREEADRVTRNLEDLDLIRERAMVAQEELLAQLAQEQNRRMYLLAIVAALFLPLSFVTGLMGMNVAGLPGTENQWSFIVLALIMTGLAAGIMGVFRWQKWL